MAKIKTPLKKTEWTWMLNEMVKLDENVVTKQIAGLMSEMSGKELNEACIYIRSYGKLPELYMTEAPNDPVRYTKFLRVMQKEIRDALLSYNIKVELEKALANI